MSGIDVAFVYGFMVGLIVGTMLVGAVILFY